MKRKAYKIILSATFTLTVAGTIIFGFRPFRQGPELPEKFGFGRVVSKQEITRWDIDVRPDGTGLPPGNGTALLGKTLYAAKCAACHAADGREIKGIKLPGPPLVSDTSARSKPKTIGNYWPYATTLFDYLRRTMPYNAPGSLTDREVYSLTAYLLHANRIIGQDAVIDAKSLPLIVMPARKLFVKDSRHGGNEVK